MILSPRSVTPSVLTSLTAALLTRARLVVCATAVSVDEAFEVTVAFEGFLAVGRRGVGHEAGIDVGLGDRVGRRRRAGRRSARSQGRCGAGGGAGRRVADREGSDGRRARVLDRERPGDGVAEVGQAVVVDVGHHRGLGQLQGRGLHDRRVRRGRSRRDRRPARWGRRRRRGVGHRAAVDVGLRDRVRRRRGAGRGDARGERRCGTGDGAGLGVRDGDAGQRDVAGVLDQERPLDLVAEVGLAVARSRR